ncbi:hypothetical protein AAZX31_12G032200 [Glycine max]
MYQTLNTIKLNEQGIFYIYQIRLFFPCVILPPTTSLLLKTISSGVGGEIYFNNRSLWRREAVETSGNCNYFFFF